MIGNLLDSHLDREKTQVVTKVGRDTKVFEERALLKDSISGVNLSTYCELCSRATVMGHPYFV